MSRILSVYIEKNGKQEYVDGIGNKVSRICHYCSVDVLKNILENESLRFSDVRFLNDSTEFIEIIPLVKYVAQHEE